MNQQEFEIEMQEKAAKIEKLNEELARMANVVAAARELADLLKNESLLDEEFGDRLSDLLTQVCYCVHELDSHQNESAFAELQYLLQISMQNGEDMVYALEAILDLDQLDEIHTIAREILGEDEEIDPEDKPF